MNKSLPLGSNLPNTAFYIKDGSLRNATPKISRNSACPIDFNKKFKKCCGKDGVNFCRKLLEKEMQDHYAKVAQKNNLAEITDIDGNTRYVSQEVKEIIDKKLEELDIEAEKRAENIINLEEKT